ARQPAAGLPVRRPLSAGNRALPSRASGRYGARGRAPRRLPSARRRPLTVDPAGRMSQPAIAVEAAAKLYRLPRERLFGPRPVVRAVDGVDLAVPAGASFG